MFRQYYGISTDPDRLTSSCYKDVYLAVGAFECLQTHFNHLHNNADSRPIVQPPKSFFWEWLRRKLKDSSARQIIFFDSYIDQNFIDEFSNILRELNGKEPYRVKQLSLHGCHLCNLSVPKFYQLIFEQIQAKEYIFSCVSGCTQDELDFNSISKFRNVQHAQKLHLFGIRGEKAALRRDGPTDEQLLDIILSTSPKFRNLQSIQMSGYNLSNSFIDKFLTVSTLDRL
jgi:hypothetical protein